MTTTTAPFSSEQQWQFETPVIGGMVVGFDGSPASYSAIESAAVIAASNEWPVCVVSVLPPMSSYKLNLGVDEPSSEIEDLRVQLRDAAIRDAIGDGCDRAGWTQQIVIGNPANEIAAVADKRAADLIVLGRSQRGAIDRLLGADATMQVMRCSSIPVLIVEDEMVKPTTVVAAVDFKLASIRAASIALQMLAAGGTLYLVHVEEPAEVFPGGVTVPHSESYPAATFVLFRRLLGQLRLPAGVVVETIVLNGMPVPAIAEFCERVGADLLAVGSRGLQRVARAFLRSVSLGLIRKVRTPVIVARERA
jgi:nucleotide-binding universal stress UspA family protein